MKSTNLRVRKAILEAGIRYTDLAETMGIHRTVLSTLYFRTEMPKKTQDELIEKVWETKKRLEGTKNV